MDLSVNRFNSILSCQSNFLEQSKSVPARDVRDKMPVLACTGIAVGLASTATLSALVFACVYKGLSSCCHAPDNLDFDKAPSQPNGSPIVMPHTLFNSTSSVISPLQNRTVEELTCSAFSQMTLQHSSTATSLLFDAKLAVSNSSLQNRTVVELTCLASSEQGKPFVTLQNRTFDNFTQPFVTPFQEIAVVANLTKQNITIDELTLLPVNSTPESTRNPINPVQEAQDQPVENSKLNEIQDTTPPNTNENPQDGGQSVKTPDEWLQLAQAYDHKGDLKNAAESYIKAGKLFLAGVTYERLHDYQSAFQSYKKEAESGGSMSSSSMNEIERIARHLSQEEVDQFRKAYLESQDAKIAKLK
jgi:hypothetical protein